MKTKLKFEVIYYDVTDGKCKTFRTLACTPLEAEDNLRQCLPENGHYEVWSIHIKKPMITLGREVIACETF